MGVDEAESILDATIPPELEAKLRAEIEARLDENADYVEKSLLPVIADGASDDEIAARAGMCAGHL